VHSSDGMPTKSPAVPNTPTTEPQTRRLAKTGMCSGNAATRQVAASCFAKLSLSLALACTTVLSQTASPVKPAAPKPTGAPTTSSAKAPATGGNIPADVRQDVALRAMVDELSRSRDLISAGAPLYFANYHYSKGDSFRVSASLGALVGKGEAPMRVPVVNVRVGNYDNDDTNFVASGMYQGTAYNAGLFPLDDNYDAMRRNWWLLTDMRYKGAVQSFNYKRAAQQNVQATAANPDFQKHMPLRLFEPLQVPQFDKAKWEKTVRSLSLEFKRYPVILDSSVHFGYSRGTEYIVNSEGSLVRRPFGIGYLRVTASTLAKDSSAIWDSLEYLAMREQDLPSEEAIRRDLDAMMQRMVAKITAPVEENYRGPVLFEGQAASQLVAQLIGRQLWIPRKPVMIPNRPVNWPRTEMEGRVGMTVISDKLTVRDDPTLTTFEKHPLIGHATVDLEAVKPEPLTLIRNGKLETLFRTRTPVNAGEQTNGRARLPGLFGANRGAPTNLIVESSDVIAEGSMKQALMDVTKAAGRPYGIVVRKLDFPTSASTDTIRRLNSTSATNAGKVRVSPPVVAYRVYPDGREELIHGVNFRELELRALRDVIAASNQMHVFHYLENGAVFAQMGTGNYVAECSVIAPSLLLEEVELEPVSGDKPTAPVVEPPALSAAK